MDGENETLEDLERKREVVKRDMEFLFETLQKEVKEEKEEKKI